MPATAASPDLGDDFSTRWKRGTFTAGLKRAKLRLARREVLDIVTQNGGRLSFSRHFWRREYFLDVLPAVQRHTKELEIFVQEVRGGLVTAITEFIENAPFLKHVHIASFTTNSSQLGLICESMAKNPYGCLSSIKIETPRHGHVAFTTNSFPNVKGIKDLKKLHSLRQVTFSERLTGGIMEELCLGLSGHPTLEVLKFDAFNQDGPGRRTHNLPRVLDLATSLPNLKEIVVWKNYGFPASLVENLRNNDFIGDHRLFVPKLDEMPHSITEFCGRVPPTLDIGMAFPYLVKLHCLGGYQLPAESFRQCPNLKTLSIPNYWRDEETADDAVEWFTNLLQGNTSLDELSLTGHLSEACCWQVLGLIPQTNLTSLELRSPLRCFEEDVPPELDNGLRGLLTCGLKKLALNLNSSLLDILTGQLKQGNSKMEELSFICASRDEDEEREPDDSMIRFLSIFSDNATAITSLSIRGVTSFDPDYSNRIVAIWETDFSSDIMKEIVQVVRKNRALKTLRVETIEVLPFSLDDFGEAFDQNTTLTNVRFDLRDYDEDEDEDDNDCNRLKFVADLYSFRNRFREMMQADETRALALCPAALRRMAPNQPAMFLAVKMMSRHLPSFSG